MSILDITKSKGVKRTLASLFATAAVVLKAFPQTEPYSEIAVYLAGLFGAVGVGHSLASKS